MSKNSHPELEGQDPQTLYTFHLKRPGQTLRERMAWSLIGLSLGLGLAAGFFLIDPSTKHRLWVAGTNQSTPSEPFKQGVNQAMGAAELTQTAEYKEDWAEVAMLWQQAIDSMAAVPKYTTNYDVAQQKVTEYGRNLQYAQQNLKTRPSRSPKAANYWTVGSDRDAVIAIQGTPTEVLQYDSSCQQILRYGNSVVELRNGYVKQYDNLGSNLRVLGSEQMMLSTQGSSDTWTLGSSMEDVLRVQGTPTRTQKYASDQFVTLYYGDSSLRLENGHVVSYVNSDKKLKVSTALLPIYQTSPAPAFWSMGASRVEVLRVQPETPSAVSRDDTTCEEVFYFNDSQVAFKQGIVVGYKDEGQTLRVR
ncbi:MAG: hypothetical protein HC922_03905 [Leptolyngbyaceae cyanobacterium SM2_3_12]|nr:hypothetical protein [Leptolyngbyaceae cyanobacterium SM2_3_12]